MIHGRETSNELSTGSVRSLQRLTRARRELVKEKNATENLIRVYVDLYFESFKGNVYGLMGNVNIFNHFPICGESLLVILCVIVSIQAIFSLLGEEDLRDLSIRDHLKLRDQTIKCLLDFAQNSISQPKEFVETEQFLLIQGLIQGLDRLDLMDAQIKFLERKSEDLFVQTVGAVLLSVSGIGVVSGTEIYAEMGDIFDFDHAGQLIKMAGTNPIVKQSGGKKP
jgi:transposase